jgi:hypothetical protein
MLVTLRTCAACAALGLVAWLQLTWLPLHAPAPEISWRSEAGSNARGYGVTYLTPAELLDFSAAHGGTATLRFDLSTNRTSLRDWVDIWITPFGDHLQLPTERTLPEGDGEPRNAVHVRMAEFLPQDAAPRTVFRASVVRDFVVQDLPGNTWTGYEQLMTPGETKPLTVELRLSRTHVKFGLPDKGFWWVDADVSDLGWERGMVQLGHHSFSPTKDCPAPPHAPPEPGAACVPNVWQWGNVSLQPVQPLVLVGASESVVSAAAPRFQLTAAAPRNALLRFIAMGSNVQYSVDAGQTWRPAQRQRSAPGVDPAAEHFHSYWTPVPAGTTEVLLTADDWWGGPWVARDPAVWALPDGAARSSTGEMKSPIGTSPLNRWLAALWKPAAQ